jgi:hypothetical protein
LGAVFAYALLLNALIAAVFNVQAIAAAIDPLSAAVTCDSTGSGSSGDPVRHNSQHQPDCTLCSPACPMGGLVQGLGSAVAVIAVPSSFVLKVSAQEKSSVNPPSVYLSDTDAQAPPAIA